MKKTITGHIREKYPELHGADIYCKDGRINWSKTYTYEYLPEEFMREFADKMEWMTISRCQRFSESFMREFSEEINWINASAFQKMSEAFIDEFSDKVWWPNILNMQKLSEDFLDEHYENLLNLDTDFLRGILKRRSGNKPSDNMIEKLTIILDSK